MKRFHNLFVLLAIFSIILGIVIFNFCTHNIYDIMSFTPKTALSSFISLFVTIFTTAFCYFPSLHKKNLTAVQLIVSTIYFLRWVIIAINKSHYFASLVSEQFIRKEINLYLQAIIFGNLIWGFALAGLSIITIAKHQKH